MGSNICLALTHCDERDALIPLVARNARSAGVQRRIAIHNEEILVMTVVQFQTGHPASVRPPVHWSCRYIPTIEIADEPHCLGRWRITVESHEVARAPGIPTGGSLP